ncbi:MAG TPA: DUF5671 domain-containing protein [Gammaproteobacteria bacterium]|nr:DUF5671 domain-containing protein [Gammaproteobacteria bacterium]
MADSRLIAFVEAALRAGASRADVEKALVDAKWSREQIADGLTHYADVPFVVPVPRPRAHLSARDAFLYLLMFTMLYLSGYYFDSLLFQLINSAFPEQLDRFTLNAIGERIRFATAGLIVAFPVFLFTAWRIALAVRGDATQRNSAIRKWLTYLTLFVGASVIVGDAITLLYNLLSGDLTVRFVLKVLVVAAIAGAVFGYYTWSIRADDEALAR